MPVHLCILSEHLGAVQLRRLKGHRRSVSVNLWWRQPERDREECNWEGVRESGSTVAHSKEKEIILTNEVCGVGTH